MAMTHYRIWFTSAVVFNHNILPQPKNVIDHKPKDFRTKLNDREIETKERRTIHGYTPAKSIKAPYLMVLHHGRAIRLSLKHSATGGAQENIDGILKQYMTLESAKLMLKKDTKIRQIHEENECRRILNNRRLQITRMLELWIKGHIMKYFKRPQRSNACRGNDKEKPTFEKNASATSAANTSKN
ncbi:hypothetical protein HELRODRAFT_165427 [Helobdella robusta]|uniref:Uncharacterized protein n=1 Tax=Helobdella robusta TaxID=6412 RepID=T1EWR9_HELRO|nr:hypothetical protein HELRODRAFT_165427 [Helobdella robusta]ESN91397.1 hypothetical protein HELRODRAFT_165427 [Helobdella robusta]